MSTSTGVAPTCSMTWTVEQNEQRIETTRLGRELAEQRGVAAYLIDGAEDIRADWLQNRHRIGVTAGASAPEVLVKDVVERLQQLGGKVVTELPGRPENIVVSQPPALRRAISARID